MRIDIPGRSWSWEMALLVNLALSKMLCGTSVLIMLTDHGGKAMAQQCQIGFVWKHL